MKKETLEQRIANARALVVSVARQEVRRTRADALPGYWDALELPGEPPANIAWCGLFALWCLKAAGLALHKRWHIGSGFLLSKDAPGPLPVVRRPEPGDVLYDDQPYQHHGIVVCVTDITPGHVGVCSIDGNLRDERGVSMVREANRQMGANGTVYYSILPLIREVLS